MLYQYYHFQIGLICQVLEDELRSLQADVQNEMVHSSSIKELLSGPQYRRAIIIALGVYLLYI